MHDHLTVKYCNHFVGLCDLNEKNLMEKLIIFNGKL